MGIFIGVELRVKLSCKSFPGGFRVLIHRPVTCLDCKAKPEWLVLTLLLPGAEFSQYLCQFK